MIFNLSSDAKRRLVLNGSLYKGIFLLSIPLMVNNLLQTLYSLADNFWVKYINGSDINQGAIGIVWPVVSLFVTFGAGIQMAGTALMSQHVGAGNKEEADRLASQLFLFTFLLGILMSVMGIASAPFVFRHVMHIQESFYPLSLKYINIMLLSLPFDFALMLFISMRQSSGDTLTPVIYMVISVILNCILDPVFILILHWGVAGAAAATIFAKLLIAPLWLRKAFTDRSAIHLSLKKMRFEKAVIAKAFLIMLPASAAQALDSFGFIILNGFISSYGDATTAAFVVGNNITNLIMMPAMGIGATLTFYVGQNIGIRNIERAKKSFHTALSLTLFIMFAAMIIFMPYPVRLWLSKLFLNQNESIRLSIQYMTFVGFSIPLMGIYQNFSGVFVGSGKTVYTLILSLTRLWIIRIPLIMYLKTYTEIGPSGIWYAMVTSNLIVCILGFFLYKLGRWKNKIV